MAYKNPATKAQYEAAIKSGQPHSMAVMGLQGSGADMTWDDAPAGLAMGSPYAPATVAPQQPGASTTSAPATSSGAAPSADTKSVGILAPAYNGPGPVPNLPGWGGAYNTNRYSDRDPATSGMYAPGGQAYVPPASDYQANIGGQASATLPAVSDYQGGGSTAPASATLPTGGGLTGGGPAGYQLPSMTIGAVQESTPTRGAFGGSNAIDFGAGNADNRQQVANEGTSASYTPGAPIPIWTVGGMIWVDPATGRASATREGLSTGDGIARPVATATPAGNAATAAQTTTPTQPMKTAADIARDAEDARLAQEASLKAGRDQARGPSDPLYGMETSPDGTTLADGPPRPATPTGPQAVNPRDPLGLSTDPSVIAARAAANAARAQETPATAASYNKFTTGYQGGLTGAPAAPVELAPPPAMADNFSGLSSAVGGLANPYTADYQARLAGKAVDTAEQQYKLMADRIKGNAANRGIGGSGIEAQGLNDLAYATAGERTRALNDAMIRTTELGAGFDMNKAQGQDSFGIARASGQQQYSNAAFDRYKDMNLLPAQIQQGQAAASQTLLQNDESRIQLQALKDNYDTLINKERMSLQLSELELSQKKWMQDNAWWLAPAGFFSSAANGLGQLGAAALGAK